MPNVVSVDIVANDRATGVFQNVGQSLTSLGAGILGISAPFAALGGSIIKTGMDFEETAHRIVAVSGDTGAKAKEDFQQIIDKSLQLGRDLPISANQAAEGLYAITTRGYSVAEAM